MVQKLNMIIDRIEGTIYLNYAATSNNPNGYILPIRFQLDDQVWEQFGASRHQLVQAGTSELMDRLQKVLAEYMLEVKYEQN